MHTTYRIALQPDGTARMCGYETGRLTVVKRTADTLVLKESGRTHFVGLNRPRAYDAAQFRVFAITDANPDMDGSADRLTCHETVSFPTR